MSDLISSLCEILERPFSERLSPDHLLIKEVDPGSKIRSILLSGTTSRMLAFYPDKGCRIISRKREVAVCMSPLLSKSPGQHHHKACDAVIIRETDEGTLSILYIEMKTGSTSRARLQFKSTTCFVQYLISICHVLHDLKLVISSEHFIVLCHREPLAARKRSTRPPLSETWGKSADDPQVRSVADKAELPLAGLI